MTASLSAYLQGLPAFLAYFGTSIVMTVLFVAVYVRLTPHREFALIKANNVAASLALGGAVLGFILPLASAMANSVSLVDFMLWGVIAFVVQAIAHLAKRLVIADLPARIANGETAAGVFAGVVSLGVGVLNAASMTW